MILKKYEVQTNTPEEVRGWLVDALNLTTELDPPSDLRVAVFTHAVSLLATKQVVVDPQSVSNGLAIPR